jgi:tRNA(Arg) A34 adenosine deaminase TadA
MTGKEVRVDLPDWAEERESATRVYSADEERMQLAVDLARENVSRRSGGPFGAAIFESDTGRLVAVGVNSVVRLNNCALHAEMVAFMRAQAAVRSYSLGLPGMPGHDLFTSCEPCAMCLGAVLWSGVRRVVYAARRDDALRLSFDEGPVFPESFAYLRRRGIRIEGGPLREEARQVMEHYRSAGGAIYNG